MTGESMVRSLPKGRAVEVESGVVESSLCRGRTEAQRQTQTRTRLDGGAEDGRVVSGWRCHARAACVKADGQVVRRWRRRGCARELLSRTERVVGWSVGWLVGWLAGGETGGKRDSGCQSQSVNAALVVGGQCQRQRQCGSGQKSRTGDTGWRACHAGFCAVPCVGDLCHRAGLGRRRAR